MQRTTVRTHKTNYRVDSWDDDRDEPYRVTFWKYGLQSVYTFDVTGHVKTLVARDTKYAFDLDAPSRMLVTSDDDRVQDVDVGFGSLVSCADCDATFTALCDVGLAEVCFLDDINRENFDGDATDSVRRFCSGFGAACEMSTAGLCEDGGCLEGMLIVNSIDVTPPTADRKFIYISSKRYTGVSRAVPRRLNRFLRASNPDICIHRYSSM